MEHLHGWLKNAKEGRMHSGASWHDIDNAIDRLMEIGLTESYGSRRDRLVAREVQRLKEAHSEDERGGDLA